MPSLIEDFISFLETSPTPWHCVRQVGNRLSMKEFYPLEEEHPWNLEKEGKYFIPRGGSIASFCIPKERPDKIVLIAAHTDSPALKVKPQPDVHLKTMDLLQVEAYGSPLLHSWLNRDLTLAGRIFYEDKQGQIIDDIICLEEIPMIIPELGIHLQRDVKDKGPLVNLQEHMLPLYSVGGAENQSLDSLLRKRFNYTKLLSFDLMLVPLEAPRFVGIKGEMLASYRLDNLTSVHGATCAIATYQDSKTLPITAFFDHEEIGSISWEGAGSSFINDILLRIQAFYSLSAEEFLILKSRSLCLSLDMAHAMHPMHKEKHDFNHPNLLGGGLAFKSHANQRYASSAKTLKEGLEIAKKAGITIQNFVSRSDMPCGSTVGPTLAAHLGIATLDLGCPQLSMHSSREIIAVNDYLDLTHFLARAVNS